MHNKTIIFLIKRKQNTVLSHKSYSITRLCKLTYINYVNKQMLSSVLLAQDIGNKFPEFHAIQWHIS